MPHEVFPIENKADGEVIGSKANRQAVCNELAATFDQIAERGGQFVTAITMVEQEYKVQEGGKPSSVTYIVADMPAA